MLTVGLGVATPAEADASAYVRAQVCFSYYDNNNQFRTLNQVPVYFQKIRPDGSGYATHDVQYTDYAGCTWTFMPTGWFIRAWAYGSEWYRYSPDCARGVQVWSGISGPPGATWKWVDPTYYARFANAVTFDLGRWWPAGWWCQ
jgi:hypothetical protein